MPGRAAQHLVLQDDAARPGLHEALSTLVAASTPRCGGAPHRG
ncbi:hypothetical protein [Nocardiopsis sp. L17-MgMaSL7]|nr:hypothetical protein [Nocardiopsis sp. L17-MgMaSL7]